MRVPTRLLSLAAVILLLVTATGCDSGNGSNNQVLTEIDFATNPSLRADPDKGVIVDSLESPGSDTPQYDTGPVGIDDIPITYTKTETRTFCWKDDNIKAGHYMVLLDSQGEEVLRVDVNGDCVKDTIEPGDYVMELHHDGSMGDPLPIFIIPNPNKNQQAMKTDGLFNGFKVEVAKILRGIQNTLSKDARAQTVQQNVYTLLTTNSCSGCDLEGVNLSNLRLTQANLSDANLTNADLSYAIVEVATLVHATLTNANLTGADLERANVAEAKFTDANLHSTNLTGAILDYANLHSTNLTGAILDYANLHYTTLTKANLYGANLNYANFSGATWCYGTCKCISGSTGTCLGCPPVNYCTGP